jgi:hypothetical protein
LEDSYGQSLGDESAVDLKSWALLAEGIEGGLTLLGDDEWRLLILDQVEELTDMLGGVGMDVLDVDVVNQRASRWLTFHLEHPSGGQQLLSGDKTGLIEVLKTVWHVVEGESLKIAESVVQWDRKSGQNKFVINGPLILILKLK